MPSLHWKGKPARPPDSAPALSDGENHKGAGPLLTEALTYPSGDHGATTPSNRLILGDNLEIMTELLAEYEGRIDLIYADPPFFTNRKFRARIGRGEDSRHPRDWAMAESYHDVWDGLDAYLSFLYERLGLMYRLLAPTGTLYLHLDWHSDAYGRVILDELFGLENLLNEIIWAYHGPSPIRSAFNRKHDTILVYAKGPNYTFNADAIRVPYNNATLKTFASSRKAGFGRVPDLARGKVPEDWWYFPVVARLHTERTGYPTQKPEALLERVILASSNPGDMVADFFCGSGTAPRVAARHGRRFVASDANWRAVHTTRARLVNLGFSPFTLERTATAPWSVRDAQAMDFGLQLDGDFVTLSPREDLIYWEVDSARHGPVFHSMGQVVRPARDGEIATSQRLGKRKTGHRVVCVRLVLAGGEQFQVLLED